MSKRAVIRCVIVSLVIALVVPLFTFEVLATIGPDGMPSRSVSLDPSGPLPEVRQLYGIEKYRYMFSTGWIWLPFLKRSALYFLIAFAASLGVSAWNAKQGRDA